MIRIFMEIIPVSYLLSIIISVYWLVLFFTGAANDGSFCMDYQEYSWNLIIIWM